MPPTFLNFWKDLRNNLLNLVISSNQIDTHGHRMALKEIEKLRNIILNETAIDIHKTWSDVYPKITTKRPKIFNYETEEIWKQSQTVNEKIFTVYYTIPKKSTTGYFHTYICPQCQQVIIKI